MMKIMGCLKSIPDKKEKLRDAFEALRSHPCYPSLGSFVGILEWKDLEDHFSPIEKSIERSLQDVTIVANLTSSEVPSRPELRSLCSNMDAKGLRSYINDNRGDLPAIREELGAAILCAPDPASLVLDAVDDFYPPGADSNTNFNGDGEVQINRRICVNLLDKFHSFCPPVVEHPAREKAKEMAEQWRAKIPNPKKGDNALEIIAFLKLVASYNLVSEFKLEDVVDLFISVSRKSQAVDLVKSLGFTDKLPDIIEKMKSRGRQLDAVKLIHAFNVADKFPPVRLLNAHIARSKKIAEGVRKKGNNSVHAQNEAISIELKGLKAVLKVVDEHKLETEYPCDTLMKTIVQLEQIRAGKKRVATTAASNSNPEQPNKRPLPSSASSLAGVVAADPYLALIQTQMKLGLADRAPHAGVYGPAATAYVYNNLGGESQILTGSMGHGGSFAGVGNLYNRPAAYDGHPLSSLPTSSGNSFFP